MQIELFRCNLYACLIHQYCLSCFSRQPQVGKTDKTNELISTLRETAIKYKVRYGAGC